MKKYSKIKEKSYWLHCMWLWLFLIIGIQSRAGDYFPNDRVLITEGQRQFRALIEQNEKNRRDGCTENNVYVFSFLSTDDWSTYIKTYTGAPEFAAPYIVELNDRLKQFNENPALGDYGMYVCIVSELEVRVAFDYTSFNVTALPDIIDAYKRYDKGIPNAGGTFSAANFEQLRVEYQNLIQKIYKGVDDNLGSGNTNYQAYKNKNNRALFTNTAVKIIIPDKDNNDHVEKQRRLYGGTVKGYFKTHLSDILDYEQIMYKDRGQIPFRNRVLSFLEYAEGQMDDPANKQIVSYSDGNANLASAVQGNSNNVVYDNTDINNQQLYLFDYTGVFGTKSQAAQDTINQLLSGQRMANNSKCRVFITDDDVNQTWIDAINNLDLTDSYFDNTLVLWIHVNPDGSTTSTIRLSDDLNAKIKDALTYGRFDQLVQIGLNTNSGSGGPNIGKEVLNFLIEVVYVSSSFLVDVLDALTIPEKIYMVNHADYDPLFKKVFSFVMPVMLVSDFVMQPLFDAYPSLDSLGVQPSDVQFALVCGLWNGLVDELKGTFELISMVGYWVDEEKKAEVEQMIDVFKEGKIIESIKKGLVEAHTGHPCKIAHTIGKDIVAVVFLVVPYTKGAALSKVRKVVDVMDALNPITYVFDAAGFVMKKAGGKIIDIVIPGLNGLNDIKIAFVEEDWLIAVEDELYGGLPINVVAKENLPYEHTAVEVISGNSTDIQAAALALLTLTDGSKVIGRTTNVASALMNNLTSAFKFSEIFDNALEIEQIAGNLALLDNAAQLVSNTNLFTKIDGLSNELKNKFFYDLAQVKKPGGASFIGNNISDLTPDLIDGWVNLAGAQSLRRNIDYIKSAAIDLSAAGYTIDDIIKHGINEVTGIAEDIIKKNNTVHNLLRGFINQGQLTWVEASSLFRYTYYDPITNAGGSALVNPVISAFPDKMSAGRIIDKALEKLGNAGYKLPTGTQTTRGGCYPPNRMLEDFETPNVNGVPTTLPVVLSSSLDGTDVVAKKFIDRTYDGSNIPTIITIITKEGIDVDPFAHWGSNFDAISNPGIAKFPDLPHPQLEVLHKSNTQFDVESILPDVITTPKHPGGLNIKRIVLREL